MNIQNILIFLGLCLLLHPALAAEELPLNELSEDVLLQRAQLAADTLSSIDTQRQSLEEQANTLQTQIDKYIVEREALEIPKPPAMTPAPQMPEQAEALIKTWEDRLQIIKKITGLLEHQQSLVKKHRSIALKLVNEHKLFQQAHQKYQPLVEVLQEKYTEIPLIKEKIPTALITYYNLIPEPPEENQSSPPAETDTTPPDSSATEIEETEPATSEQTDAAKPQSTPNNEASHSSTSEKTTTTDTNPSEEKTSQDQTTKQSSKQSSEKPLTAQALTDKWQNIANRDEIFLEEIQTSLESLAKTQEETTQGQQQATIYLQQATQRAQWQEEYNNQELVDLVALLTTRFDKWQQSLKDFTTKKQAFSETQTTVKNQQETLANMTPPTVEQLDTDEADSTATPSLQDARKSLRLAQANLEFRQQRLAQMRELETTLQTYREKLTAFVEQTETLLTETKELIVLYQVIQTKNENAETPLPLPEEIRITSLEQQTENFQSQLQDLKSDQEAEKNLTETLQKQQEEANAFINEATEAVEEKTKLLEREEQWASFLKQTENAGAEELITTFQTTIQEFATYQEKLATQKERLANSEKLVMDATKKLEAHKDPASLDYSDKKEAFKQWYESENLHLEPPESLMNNEVQSEHVNEETPQTPETAKSQSVSPTTEKDTSQPTLQEPIQAVSQTQQYIQQMTAIRDQEITRYLNALQEGQSLRQDLTTYLQAHQEQLNFYLQQLEKSLELARQAWGTATRLQMLMGKNELNSADLPENLDKWTSREQVLNMQTEIETIKKQKDAAQSQYDQLQETTMAEKFIPVIQELRENMNQHITKLRETLELEQNFQQPPMTELEEFEQRQRQRQIEQRMQQDEILEEKILAVMVSQYTEELDKLLEGYYKRLLNLENQLENLTEQEEIKANIIQLLQTRRDIYQALTGLVKAKLDEVSQKLAIETTQVKAVFFPSQTNTLLKELEENQNVKIKLSELPQLPTGADAETVYQAKSALIQNLFEWWTLVKGYQSWLNTLNEQTAELGHLDQEIAKLKDQTASLNSRREELMLQKANYVGHDKNYYEKLPPSQRPQTKEEREEFFLGEIGLLRQERLETLYWGAFRTLGWLILIPIIAFIAIKIVHLMGRRAIARASRLHADEDPAAQKEREERVKILYHVANTGWTILVVVLSIIYMFKAINVDVLPLLASAGILGLAFAFGSQQLVKDFFSGFFVLLENQFKVGDLVTIDGIKGSVERVTPRLTIVRDTAGAVHYFSNGSMGHIANHNRGWESITFDIPVSYETPIEEVYNHLQSVKDSLLKDAKFGRIIRSLLIRGINSFEEHAVLYGVQIKTMPDEQFGAAREFRRRIKSAFDEAGISMPSQQQIRSVHVPGEPQQAENQSD